MNFRIGRSKYQVTTGQYEWIAGNEYANGEGLYLGRISSPEQYQWILDDYNVEPLIYG